MKGVEHIEQGAIDTFEIDYKILQNRLQEAMSILNKRRGLTAKQTERVREILYEVAESIDNSLKIKVVSRYTNTIYETSQAQYRRAGRKAAEFLGYILEVEMTDIYIALRAVAKGLKKQLLERKIEAEQREVLQGGIRELAARIDEITGLEATAAIMVDVILSTEEETNEVSRNSMRKGYTYLEKLLN